MTHLVPMLTYALIALGGYMLAVIAMKGRKP